MEKSRACASMVGGAIGDALGMALEIFPKSNDLNVIHDQVLIQRKTSPKLTDYTTGGPWKDSGLILKAGEWTDDTAMMLCLADTLLHTKTIHVKDLMVRFVMWWFQGYNSCTGKSVGLGGNIKNAIYSFDRRNPHKLLGGTNPQKDAGNGSLMRLAPVPIYFHDNFNMMIKAAKIQTATTHNVSETIEGSMLMANIIWMGISGKTKHEIFDNMGHGINLYDESITELLTGSWKDKKECEIRTLPGRCLWSLEAAIWCVYHTNTFEDALVKAVNLGGDADTVGSIAGQIAGAIYGMESIPSRWTNQLHHYEKIYARATALYDKKPFHETMNLRK